jgi:hypothetical protein
LLWVPSSGQRSNAPDTAIAAQVRADALCRQKCILVMSGDVLIQRRVCSGTILLCLTALIGCAATSVPSWCASEDGDVAYSTEPGSFLTLDSVWKFQPANPLQFPVSVTVSDEGTLAVLDFATGDVGVITPDGASAGPWLGTDQVQSPFALNWRDGSLVVFDAMGEKVVWSSSGVSIREERLPRGSVESLVQGAGASWAGVLSDGTILLQPLIQPDMDRPDVSWQKSSVYKISPANGEARRIVELEVRTLAPGMGSGIPAPGWPFPRLAAAGGRYAVGGTRSEYTVTIHGGAAQLTICREEAGADLRADELGETGTGPRVQAVRRVEKPDRPSAFGRIVLGPNGEVLIQRDRPSPLANEVFGRPGAMYDVFDPNGGLVGHVQAPEGVIFHAILAESVWGIEDLDGQKSVVRYRLKNFNAEGSP